MYAVNHCDTILGINGVIRFYIKTINNKGDVYENIVRIKRNI
jgi:hypothetical protein